ncbi:e3 ubiquitin-protein ligase RNF13 [Trichonephila clavipes]|uniref:E3 ubiquitin-protein ligase RNF13 n=1 Tax=Trichonephila clavipes TaxID=2585209 RepID=A0A8X6SFS0_TRICX|nr:e3 ubiquitin-protein ligase RNF13 [Trichonephila clavipes]
MAPHTFTSTVGAVYRCKAKAGLRRSPRGLCTRIRLSSLCVLRLNLNSSLKMTWFHSDEIQFPRARHYSKRGIDGWASRAAHVRGAAIPNVLQPGAFVWFEKTHGPLVKVLPVPGLRPMKQLAVRMDFFRCGGLLDDWYVEGVLCLVFV